MKQGTEIGAKGHGTKHSGTGTQHNPFIKIGTQIGAQGLEARHQEFIFLDLKPLSTYLRLSFKILDIIRAVHYVFNTAQF